MSSPRPIDVALHLCIHVTSKFWSVLLNPRQVGTTSSSDIRVLSWLIHRVSTFHERKEQSSADGLALFGEFFSLFPSVLHDQVFHILTNLHANAALSLAAFTQFLTVESCPRHEQFLGPFDCIVRQYLQWMRLTWECSNLDAQSLLFGIVRGWRKQLNLETILALPKLGGNSSVLKGSAASLDLDYITDVIHSCFNKESFPDVGFVNGSVFVPIDNMTQKKLPINSGTAFAMVMMTDLYLSLNSPLTAIACADVAVHDARQTKDQDEVLSLAHLNRFRCQHARGLSALATEDLTIAFELCRYIDTPTMCKLRAVCYLLLAELFLYFPGTVDENLRRGLLQTSHTASPETGLHTSIIEQSLVQSIEATLFLAEESTYLIPSEVTVREVRLASTILRSEMNRLLATPFQFPLLKDCSARAVIISKFRMLQLGEDPTVILRQLKDFENIERGDQHLRYSVVLYAAAQHLFAQGLLLEAKDLLSVIVDGGVQVSMGTFSTLIMIEVYELLADVFIALQESGRASQCMQSLEHLAIHSNYALGVLRAKLLSVKLLQGLGKLSAAIEMARAVEMSATELQYEPTTMDAKLRLLSLGLYRRDAVMVFELLVSLGDFSCNGKQRCQMICLLLQIMTEFPNCKEYAVSSLHSLLSWLSKNINRVPLRDRVALSLLLPRVPEFESTVTLKVPVPHVTLEGTGKTLALQSATEVCDRILSI